MSSQLPTRTVPFWSIPAGAYFTSEDRPYRKRGSESGRYLGQEGGTDHFPPQSQVQVLVESTEASHADAAIERNQLKTARMNLTNAMNALSEYDEQMALSSGSKRKTLAYGALDRIDTLQAMDDERVEKLDAQMESLAEVIAEREKDRS